MSLSLAVGTPAGEEIRNQATANYIDSAGEAQSANSNQVITIVRQIYDVSVVTNGSVATPGQLKDATPGSTVYYPYTLTNTGNGLDSFDLTSTIDTDDTSDNGGIGTPVFYLDTNGDGVVQTGEPIITTVTDLDANATNPSVKLIMAYQIPSGADTGDEVIATPVATSVNDPAAIPAFDNDNYHQTTVIQDAVLSGSKQANKTELLPGESLQFTITSTNTGSQDATAVVISDAVPAGTTFVSASTVPAANGTTIVLDTTDPSAMTATFNTVIPGQTVRFIFSVTVDSTTAPGPIENTATVNYDKAAGAADPVTTNTTSTTVNAQYDVALGPKDDPEDDDTVDDDYTTAEGYTVTTTDGDDEQVVASANAGTSVSFINSVKNNGTASDIFNLTRVNSLPAGASVVFTRLDGTPLGSTDGDGTPDTGPIAPGAEFDFIVKVILPQGFDNQDGDTTVYSTVITATSSSDPTQTDSTTNTIEDIVGPGVDMGNNVGAIDNDGAVDSAVGVDVTANPNAPAIFAIDIVNDGSNDDSYDLTGSVGFTRTDGGTTTVNVVYYPAAADTDGDGTLSAAEIAAATPISNTGTVASGDEITVFAVATVPANAAPQTATVTQSVTSPLSGATDSFDLNTVTVNAIKTFNFSPDRSGTAPSPGTVIYQHVINNTGNLAITDVDLTEAPSGNVTGWSYVYSYDGATYYPAASLPATTIAAKSSQSLFVKVNVPAGVPKDASNILEITAAPTFGTDGASTGSATVTDTTIVVSGEIRVEKSWSLDGGTTWYRGDGTDGSTPPQVAPGEDILYRMIVTNIGTADVTDVDLLDSVPTFTDFVIASQTTNPSPDASVSITCSTDGGSSYAACPTTGPGIDSSITTLKYSFSLLAPGASKELRFTVRVQ